MTGKLGYLANHCLCRFLACRKSQRHRTMSY